MKTVLTSVAHWMGAVAILFLTIGLIIFGVAAYTAISGEAVSMGTLYTAAFFLGAGFWLLLLAQLFHIRAALEK